VPPALDELGLVPALHELADRYRVGGLRVEVTGGGGLDAVEPAVAGAVYGIVSEAVRNVHRHAAASCCTVSLEAGEELVVVVEDDGIGIDPTTPKGVGLTSMRERAEGVGGTLSVAPAEQRGTRVEVRIPVLVGVEP
jgi:signal transduction histidine kinase